MTRPLDCIVLIDDDEGDNFLHELAIEDAGCAQSVVAFEKPERALEELRAGRIVPDLILLDINMPGMDGWEFLTEYDRLPDTLRQAIVILMLTTSLNPQDRERAEREPSVAGFRNKPLTAEQCLEVLERHFSDR